MESWIFFQVWAVQLHSRNFMKSIDKLFARGNFLSCSLISLQSFYSRLSLTEHGLWLWEIFPVPLLQKKSFGIFANVPHSFLLHLILEWCWVVFQRKERNTSSHGGPVDALETCLFMEQMTATSCPNTSGFMSSWVSSDWKEFRKRYQVENARRTA